MTPERARKLLNLGVVHDPSDVREAYTAALMENHPDHGGDGTCIAELQAAKKVLLNREQSTIHSCALCRGTGYIRGKVAKRICTACDGTGERRG